ncbi:MAG: alpha/beta hydrolase fold protein [Acidimicrobiaceae bacterium]|nr:alpha/beta hydrolase fold protein [Acidimicrobiaceae bacterium]
MNYREELVDVPDGRVVEVGALGDPEGRTVFLHHGSPGSVRTLTSFAPLLEQGNFYIVTMSRPGYGRSSRLEGREIASVVADVARALDAFGRTSYVALGWSGGGPHALACAALDAPRCRGAVSLAGVVPIDVDFDWSEGMAPENLEEFALAKEGGPAYEAAMEAAGAFMGGMNRENAFDLFGDLLSEPDKEALADEAALDSFIDATTHAFVESWRGFYDDDLTFYKPWGFDPALISVPVEIFYGDQDHMVPPTHGAWLASHIPTARVFHDEREGHLSIWMRHFDKVAKALRGVDS